MESRSQRGVSPQ